MCLLELYLKRLFTPPLPRSRVKTPPLLYSVDDQYQPLVGREGLPRDANPALTCVLLLYSVFNSLALGKKKSMTLLPSEDTSAVVPQKPAAYVLLLPIDSSSFHASE